jgi:hypothetical protein
MDSSDYRRPSLTCRRAPNRPAARGRLTGGLRCRRVHEAIYPVAVGQEPGPGPDGVSVLGEHAGPLAAASGRHARAPAGSGPHRRRRRSARPSVTLSRPRTTLASTMVGPPVGRVGGVVRWGMCCSGTPEHAEFRQLQKPVRPPVDQPGSRRSELDQCCRVRVHRPALNVPVTPGQSGLRTCRRTSKAAERSGCVAWSRKRCSCALPRSGDRG